MPRLNEMMPSYWLVILWIALILVSIATEKAKLELRALVTATATEEATNLKLKEK